MNSEQQIGRKKVLFLADFCPWPLDNGYRQRMFHLIRALSARHDVTLATVMPDEWRGRPFPPAEHCVDLIPLSEAGCAFKMTGRFERWAPARDRLFNLLTSPFPSVVRRFRSGDILATLRKYRDSHACDVVWAERPYIAELARQAGFSRIVVDLPDIESQLYARVVRNTRWYASKPLHWLECLKLYVYDQLLPLRFWRLVPCKNEDRLFFRLRRSNVVTLPNGVERYPASRAVGQTDAPQLLWVGGLNYESSIDAVRFFAQSILPLIKREYPQARFIVVGRDPIPGLREELVERGATVLTDVSDLTPNFDMASLFVAPIRMGSGTRLKVLEAMMRQKAVVATSVAAEGLDVRSGVHLELADTAVAFASACCRLLGDATARQTLALSARTHVTDHYLWDQLLTRTESVLSDAPGDQLT
jgi:glycosyltransferase involved in cell wall biosynthesis